MQGHRTLRVSGRVAKVKLRVEVSSLPSGAEIELTDLMFQPGGTPSGWLPHVTELPWAAGVSEDTSP